jgi:hypothetical protein
MILFIDLKEPPLLSFLRMMSQAFVNKNNSLIDMQLHDVVCKNQWDSLVHTMFCCFIFEGEGMASFQS